MVKKDTASYDVVHGSSRSKINGKNIMRRSTFVKNNKATISFKINGETIMRRSTVVKKDNEETIMRRSTVMKKDCQL